VACECFGFAMMTERSLPVYGIPGYAIHEYVLLLEARFRPYSRSKGSRVGNPRSLLFLHRAEDAEGACAP
jgi:hypothetical protein